MKEKCRICTCWNDQAGCRNEDPCPITEIGQPAGNTNGDRIRAMNNAELAEWRDGSSCPPPPPADCPEDCPGDCKSCWKMTLKERIAAMITGKMWVMVRSGYTQPPICIVTKKPIKQSEA